jgi:hypothetical protein
MGSTMVLGDDSPILVIRLAPKNLSSALHQKGLLMQ